MAFDDLTGLQQAFLAKHMKAGKTLAAKAANPPVDPQIAAQEDWKKKLEDLKGRVSSANTSGTFAKVEAALNKSEAVYSKRFDANKANKALGTIQKAFKKMGASTSKEAAIYRKRLMGLEKKFLGLQKMSFPDKDTISTRIQDKIDFARSAIEQGEFPRTMALIRDADTLITGAKVGVDAGSAKDLKPADLKVLMATKEGQLQLDSIVDNLSDDVPPKVMQSILEARFELGRISSQDTSDREGSMMDQAKHGAMLDTDSPKLKKIYREMMEKKRAEENAQDAPENE